MIFGFVSLAVAYHLQQSEAKQANEEIKAHYEKMIDENKSHYEDTIAEIKKSNEKSNEDIRKAVFVLASGQDLWDTFPNGYVVFYGKGKNPQVAPVFNHGYEYPVADWKDTKIALHPPNRTFEVGLTSLSWLKPDGTPGHTKGSGLVAGQSGSYVIGKPVPVGAFHEKGQISPYFEVLDDNPDHQVCVIGFKT
jgi:hypothetical protein